MVLLYRFVPCLVAVNADHPAFVRIAMEMVMEYFHGERVRILGKPEWGAGYILGASRNGRVKVRFQNCGKKVLDLHHAKLMKVVLRDPEWLEQRAREAWARRQQSCSH